jgi:hypothetical protein
MKKKHQAPTFKLQKTTNLQIPNGSLAVAVKNDDYILMEVGIFLEFGF